MNTVTYNLVRLNFLRLDRTRDTRQYNNINNDNSNNSYDWVHEGQRDSADNAGVNGAFDCRREGLKLVDDC